MKLPQLITLPTLLATAACSSLSPEAAAPAAKVPPARVQTVPEIASSSREPAAKVPPAEESAVVFAGEISRKKGPDGLSGVTWVCGDRYVAVNDRNGEVCRFELPIHHNGKPKSFDPEPVFSLEGASDLEAVAYDSANNLYWAADEETSTLLPFRFPDEEGAAIPSPIVVEPVKGGLRVNRGLESLTINAELGEMWTCNEEALKADGEKSTRKKGSPVRLIRYAREKYTEPWEQAGQFVYETDPIGGGDFRNASCSGVSDLCLLDNGALLVLEREMSVKSFIPTFRCRIYLVDFSLATDVTGMKGLVEGSYTAVSKHLVFERNTGFSMYEGMCLGPELSTGERVLTLISDGGGEALESVMTLRVK